MLAVLLEELEVGSDLAKAHEKRKYLHARLREALCLHHVADLAARVREQSVVPALLRGGHRAIGNLHNLVGQVLGHRFL